MHFVKLLRFIHQQIHSERNLQSQLIEKERNVGLNTNISAFEDIKNIEIKYLATSIQKFLS